MGIIRGYGMALIETENTLLRIAKNKGFELLQGGGTYALIRNGKTMHQSKHWVMSLHFLKDWMDLSPEVLTEN